MRLGYISSKLHPVWFGRAVRDEQPSHYKRIIMPICGVMQQLIVIINLQHILPLGGSIIQENTLFVMRNTGCLQQL